MANTPSRTHSTDCELVPSEDVMDVLLTVRLSPAFLLFQSHPTHAACQSLVDLPEHHSLMVLVLLGLRVDLPVAELLHSKQLELILLL